MAINEIMAITAGTMCTEILQPALQVIGDIGVESGVSLGLLTYI